VNAWAKEAADHRGRDGASGVRCRFGWIARCPNKWGLSR
jgi:hypothetical protein